ncbi:MAG: hypothetical protein IMW93_11365 [Thermoanaerobacteraceae bacterium]|nr:hypothetical protein [Thermoanaerobacteraceae bacterium]
MTWLDVFDDRPNRNMQRQQMSFSCTAGTGCGYQMGVMLSQLAASQPPCPSSSASCNI